MKFINWLKSLFAKKQPEQIVNEPIPLEPRWMTIAKKELGVKETRESNKRIEEYHRSTGLKGDLIHQDTPWCASFTSWCLEQSGIVSKKSAWARSYLGFGVKLETPRYGCIVVFKRGKDSGHVGFWVDENSYQIKVLSGNQNNSVCYQWYLKSNLLGYRWPK